MELIHKTSSQGIKSNIVTRNEKVARIAAVGALIPSLLCGYTASSYESRGAAAIKKDTVLPIIQPFIVDATGEKNDGAYPGSYQNDDIDAAYMEFGRRVFGDTDGVVVIATNKTEHVVTQPSEENAKGNACYSLEDMTKLDSTTRQQKKIGENVITSYFLNGGYLCESDNGTMAFAHNPSRDKKNRSNVYMPSIQVDTLTRQLSPELPPYDNSVVGIIGHETGHSLGLGHMGEITNKHGLVFGDVNGSLRQGLLQPIKKADNRDVDPYASYASTMGKKMQRDSPIYSVAEYARIAPDRFRVDPIANDREGLYDISALPGQRNGVSLVLSADSALKTIDPDLREIVIVPRIIRRSETGQPLVDGIEVFAMGSGQNFNVTNSLNDKLCAMRIADGIQKNALFTIDGMLVYVVVKTEKSNPESIKTLIGITSANSKEGIVLAQYCKTQVNERNALLNINR